MSEQLARLAERLQQVADRLWQLQNAALRLATEGPSPTLCAAVACGLQEIGDAVGEAGPAGLRAELTELAGVLQGEGGSDKEVQRAFRTVEALVSIQRGEGGSALLGLLGTPEPPPGVPPAAEPVRLVDRADAADPEDLRLFAAEAREHVQSIEAALVQLESSGNLDLIGEAFRGVHSIKGGAQYLGLEATATLAHQVETLLDHLRSGKRTLASPAVSALLRSLDVLSRLVDALEHDGPGAVDVGGLVEEMARLIAGEGPTAAEAPPRHPPVAADSPHPNDDELFESEYLQNMGSARQLLGELSRLPADPEKAAVATRSLHSLKGLAGLVGITQMERVAGALDALVSRVCRHGREVVPDVQRAVLDGLDLLDRAFEQHRAGGPVSVDVEGVVSAIEALAETPGGPRPMTGADATGPRPLENGGPLADRFRALMEAARGSGAGEVRGVLDALGRDASLHGYDELVAAVDLLQRDLAGLATEQLRDRLLQLRALLPTDLVSLPATEAVPAAPVAASFEAAVLAVPGLGRKKLRRLIEAGIDSRQAALAAGLQGLIGVPGISLEQAKMLLAGWAEPLRPGDPAPSPPQEKTRTLDQQVLDDDYDRQLVGIYLDTTIRQIDAVKEGLGEGHLGAASEILQDLAGAARYMGYRTLVDSFGAAKARLSADPVDLGGCLDLLSPVRVAIERLRREVNQPGPVAPPSLPSEGEVKELERIFIESAEGHVASLRRAIPQFLARMDEPLLASMQHHLGCLQSAATNLGRQRAATAAGRLQARIEDLWLSPGQVTDEVPAEVMDLFAQLAESCGLGPVTLEATVALPEPPAPEPLPSFAPSIPPVPPASPAATAAPQSSDLEAVLEQLGEPTLQAAAPLSQPSKAVPSPSLRPDAELRADELGAAPDGEAARSLVDAQATVRVDTSKIDDLMNMVAELVVNRSAFMVLGTTMSGLVGKLVDSGQIAKVEARDLRTALTRYDEAMTELGRVSNQLQQGVMRIRMMPVRTLFSRVPRLVRDLALREERQVKVVFSGEETELDKTVIERLSDPLVHLIRNAISHGIEPPADRVAAGKPAEGRLLISARHQGNIVIIEVEDDGRGIDFEKVRRHWTESGLGSAAQVARLTSAELLAAIFLPGFSTADHVTDVSGRGVGLDVVKRNIENLGGQVEASTEAGRFSRFTIRIPLTMAIMQALLVRVRTEVYAIPVSAVIQAERITRSQILSVESQKVITIRNSVVPLVELDEIFAYNYYLETAGLEPREAAPPESPDDTVYVVVLQGEGREIGIVVNGLVGGQDIVIKSLEDELADGRGVAGASILGDGTVTLILDVGEIQKMVVDGQHSEEMRRSEIRRRLERYIQERGLQGAERTIHELTWQLESSSSTTRH